LDAHWGKDHFVYHDPELLRNLKTDDLSPGEDIYFSWKARRAGFNLWVDTGADLLHHVPTLAGRRELVESFLLDIEVGKPSERLARMREKMAIWRGAVAATAHLQVARRQIEIRSARQV